MSELRDAIEQAIADSLDVDWQPSHAANAIMELPAIKELVELAYQYQSDLRFPVSPDSRERRLARISDVLARAA